MISVCLSKTIKIRRCLFEGPFAKKQSLFFDFQPLRGRQHRKNGFGKFRLVEKALFRFPTAFEKCSLRKKLLQRFPKADSNAPGIILKFAR